ncbi:septum formation family protein [Micromonospora thermarum]|uniref:septum formation family protein n=1 Tax=Micromonospora thermarum TaxID=2720024 RepID=UPI00281678D5|nr:septum formation family protein [Micromonospora thermarum]
MKRRWLTAVALGGAVVLALTGCVAPPAGTDGDLVDDWATISAPAAFTPEAGTCHAHVARVGYLGAYDPVPCERPHRVETLHVGTLTGAAAKERTPPSPGSAGMRTAHATCDREATRALGADWRSGRVGLSVVFPSPAAWTGGARWFRCDGAEIRSMDDPSVVTRTAGLGRSLAGSSPLRHTCFNPSLKDDRVTRMTPVSCTRPHHAEFVGVWVAPDTSYAAFTKDDRRVRDGCLALIATYTKVPRGEVRFRTGSIWYHPLAAEWRDGNRGVQCFLWVSDRDLTRSMKGAGRSGLPMG